MKSKIMMLVTGLALGAIACNDASTGSEATKDSSTVTTTNTDNTRVDLDVPAPARTSFETKYPNASNVKWSRYQPEDRSAMEPSDWNYNLDSNDYVVMFNWDNADYYAWYDDGNWVRTSSRMADHSKLPAAVNDAIRKQFSGYEIVEVDKENDKDRTAYEVDLKKGEEDKLKITFAEDGTVLKKKGKVDGEKVKEKVDQK